MNCRRYFVALLAGLFIATASCEDRERVARLEQQNQELQAKLQQTQSVADLDLQAKCSEASERWFAEHWRRDRDTLLLDHRNHYDKKLGQCFVLVEYHYTDPGGGPSWYNDISLWNVFENSQDATVAEYHFIELKPGIKPENHIISCKVLGAECKSTTEFNNQIATYLND